jgi:hypothetical protein
LITNTGDNIKEDTRTQDQKVLDAIHFMLAHFQQQPPETLFPRTIMTASTIGQVVVNSVEEIFAWFKAAKYKDCRINAFPKYTSYGNINRQPANFIFIDFDLSSFGYDFRRIDAAVRNTLKKIASVFGPEIIPTILWTGGGYHLYLPLSGNTIPEQHQVFAEFADWWRTHEFKDLTSVFMGFAEEYLTGGKQDKSHVPTVKSCLLRVPYTINAKYDDEFSEVRIMQSAYNSEDGSNNKADMKIAAIQYILKDFRHFLFDHQTQTRLDQLRQSAVKKYNNGGGGTGNTTSNHQQQQQQQQQQIQQQTIIIDDTNSMIRMKQRARKMGMSLNKKRFQEYREKRRQQLQQQQQQKRRFSNNTTTSSDVSVWVEHLLQVGLPDFRKRAVSLILAPYLVHKRKLSDDQAAAIMVDWLVTRCAAVQELSFKPERKVREALQQARQSGGIMHMSYKTLQEQSPETYQILETNKEKGGNNKT